MKMYSEALRSNEKLKKIIEVLHNVPCTRFSPLPVRMAAMEALADQYSANVLCEALCVNRSTFHHHMEDNKRENTWFNFRRNKLKKAIVEIYNEHNQIPGVKKIRALLQEQGNDVSEKMVRELMVELGISSIRNDAKEIYLSKAKEYDEINLKNLCPGDQPDQVGSAISLISICREKLSMYALLWINVPEELSPTKSVKNLQLKWRTN